MLLRFPCTIRRLKVAPTSMIDWLSGLIVSHQAVYGGAIDRQPGGMFDTCWRRSFFSIKNICATGSAVCAR